MNVSEQILRCKKCEEYAKKYDPHNWRELFNSAWLKIRERELNDQHFDVKYYKTYFQTVLRNCKYDAKIKNKRIIIVESYQLDSFTDEHDHDKWQNEAHTLHHWLQKQPEDEFEQFLQNIIILTLHSKSRQEAIDLTEMSRRSFHKYLKIAKQRIKNEHNKSNHNHSDHISFVV